MPMLASMTPLQVFDMPRAVAVHQDKLGFEVVAHSPCFQCPA